MKNIVLNGINETIYYEKLEDVLDVYLLPMKGKTSFNITLNVKFGSTTVDFKDNDKNKNIHLPFGTAHFLEHLMFKMEDGSDATNYFYALGSDANAFTTYNQTAYTINATSHFNENLSMLIKYVFSPYFTKTNVKEEKGIIKSETTMGDDDIDTKLMNTINENLFIKDNMKYKICGTVEDVSSIKLDDIENAYNYFYHPSNMFLVITGNFNYEESLAILEKCFANIKFNKIPNITIKKPKEPMKVNKELITLDGKSKKVIFGFKVSLKNKDKDIHLLNNYMNVIISSNFGRTSDFQNKLLTGNIINMPLSMQVYYANSYYVIYIMADTNYFERLYTLMKEKIKKLTITNEELERKKKVIMSDYILSTDDVVAVNSYIQSEIIKYNEIDDKLYNKINSMNYKEISSIISSVNLKNMVVVRYQDKENE